MANQRIAGLIQVQVNGEIQDAKGEFTYNLGVPKRSTVIGADGVHGYKEEAQVPFIEGTLTDRGTMDVAALAKGKDLTVTLTAGNGKMISLTEAWYAGEGNVTTGESEVAVRWEGRNAEEIV